LILNNFEQNLHMRWSLSIRSSSSKKIKKKEDEMKLRERKEEKKLNFQDRKESHFPGSVFLILNLGHSKSLLQHATKNIKKTHVKDHRSV
jgi:hypothetical protein